MRPTTGQIDDLLAEIRDTVARGERALVTTLTKKMAEDLADYLAELGIKVQWLHSEVDTLERVEILRDLRLGVYDVLVGINLLREGLDLPEVTLVAILDADKEGFLRSGGSLIQVIGRAARNIGGRVIMYADRETDSMRAAIEETSRRREKQVAYNTEHGIVPETIIKEIRDINSGLRRVAEERAELDVAGKEPEELASMMTRLEAQMKEAARNLEFERAAALRDEILQLRRLREELAAAPGSIPADVYAAAAEAGEFGTIRRGGRRARSSAPRRGRTSSPPDRAAGRRAAAGRREPTMAGTMPHAIFVETGIDDGATVAAYAAELPGCAVFAASDVEATNEMPRRVARFVDWLRASGEEAPDLRGRQLVRGRAGRGCRRQAGGASASTTCRRATRSSAATCTGWSWPASCSPTGSTPPGRRRQRTRWSGSSGRTSRSPSQLGGNAGGAQRRPDRPPLRGARRADRGARGGRRHGRRRATRAAAGDRRRPAPRRRAAAERTR